MKVTALMSVWNSSQWLPWSLRGIYPFVDFIVVCEACWVKEAGYEGKTSPDGTARRVFDFMKWEDPENKVTFLRKGRCVNQPQARNFALDAVSPDTDWIWQVDADEFYQPIQMRAYRELMERSPASVSCYNIPAKCFYFDFTHFKREHFTRLYRYYPGIRCTQIASFSVQGSTVTVEPNDGAALQHLVGSSSAATQCPDTEYFHYSYVGPEWTRVKACMGEDLPAQQYRRWWEEVFSRFDGSPASLEALYQKNGGGIHVMGGGPLERYDGEHPAVLDDHPLRRWKWEQAAG